VLGVHSEQQCSILQEHPHSYPLGKVSVKGIHILSKNASLHDCLSLCCNEGPTLCHKIWLYKSRCVALPCLTNKTACSPQSIEKLPSIVVSVKYGNNETGNQTTPG